VNGIRQDRLAGLRGRPGAAAVPGTTRMTSCVEVPGEVKKFRSWSAPRSSDRPGSASTCRSPTGSAARSGFLEILGGRTFSDEQNYFEEEIYMNGPTGPSTFEGLVTKLATARRNDQVLADLMPHRRPGSESSRNAEGWPT
jgi:hypothetical protein